MHRIVLDTCVVVAAMLSRRGASNRLLRLVGDPRLRISLSVPLVLEYESALARQTGKMKGSDIETVLSYMLANADLRRIFFLWRPLLPDPGDHLVLELAVEAGADFIVTFNRRDFGPAEKFGIGVITPGEFLAILGEAR